MYRVVHGNAAQTSDSQSFIDLLNKLPEHPFSPARELFDSKQELLVTRAPGRLDVMGGIADYSGSLVLELPIAEATFAALQLKADRHLNIVTLLDDEASHLAFAMSLDNLVSGDKPIEYETARNFFGQNIGNHWATYVAGAFLVLMRERGLSFASGANILLSSRVPPGKGVSSSAALEVAVMQAVTKAFNIQVEPRDTALLCQKVENLVAGAPCGVMDQMTAVLGEQDRLLLLLCQPAELKKMIPLSRQLMLWGIDSGIRHSVGGADYGSVRTGTFMGQRIIAELEGITDRPHGGYLANISPAEFETKYAAQIPERISGQAFIERYKRTADPVTSIDPTREYAVRLPTSHPIYEHARVQRFVNLLEQISASSEAESLFGELGELMYQSHQSYTALGLNSDGTDLIVDLVRQEGPAAGLFGAKITGGGSGGTVAVLGDRRSSEAIDRITKVYADETGHQPSIFSGSSPGSATFDHLRLRPS
jgi:galactokinase